MIHINGAVAEVADFLAIVGTEYKSGTNEKFFTINVLKRRRIDASEAEFAKFNYLAHPFKSKNPFALIDDVGTDKILSLQSLASDVDLLDGKEKANATKRLKLLEASEFDENY